MIKFSVTRRNGEVLDPSLYTWDEKTKTFSSKEDGLVLDFAGVHRVTFDTGHSCAFKTGYDCTFKTGSYCTFNAGPSCTFKTGFYCSFKTDSYCTFNTSFGCTFNTGHSCTFNTGSSCTFKTSSYCAFNTGFNCTFEVGDNCSLIRYDVKGVTEIPANKKIKLNGSGIAGYTVIEEKKEVPTCNGKVVEIDGKKYQLTEIKE
jgi:uncharacterized cupin superfamily protein